MRSANGDFRWSAFFGKFAKRSALEQGREAVQAELAASQAAADARKNSREIHRTCVAERLANLPKNADQRNPLS